MVQYPSFHPTGITFQVSPTNSSHVVWFLQEGGESRGQKQVQDRKLALEGKGGSDLEVGTPWNFKCLPAGGSWKTSLAKKEANKVVEA